MMLQHKFVSWMLFCISVAQTQANFVRDVVEEKQKQLKEERERQKRKRIINFSIIKIIHHNYDL